MNKEIWIKFNNYGYKTTGNSDLERWNSKNKKHQKTFQENANISGTKESFTNRGKREHAITKVKKDGKIDCERWSSKNMKYFSLIQEN